MGLSTDRILGRVLELARPVLPGAGAHLDIGAGTGALIGLIRGAHPGVRCRACDYTDSLMQLDDQSVDIANLDADPLPYPADSFDLVTCTEVIEHLENFRRLVRETFRVTKPGGAVIFSTPNILNLRSRLRFLFFGFWNLFGPLPVGRAETYSTLGHISPVSYFYLAHALSESGFVLDRLTTDKWQRTAVAPLLVLWPLIAPLGAMARRRESRRHHRIDDSNRAIVESMNRVKMLLGRTIIVLARKPV